MGRPNCDWLNLAMDITTGTNQSMMKLSALPDFTYPIQDVTSPDRLVE